MHFIKFLIVVSTLFFLLPIQVAWGETPEIPVKDTVTMVDLGSTSCVPCKLMEPVLEKLREEYRDRAAILFVNVAKDRESARKFGVRAIPTQIFFDAQGNEVWRHAGFLEQQVIEKKIDGLLVR